MNNEAKEWYEEYKASLEKAEPLIREFVQAHYTLIKDLIDEISVNNFYDGPVSGRVKLHNGKLGKYALKQDYENEGLPEDVAECSSDFRYYLVTLDEGIVGYITEAFIGEFRPMVKGYDGKESRACFCELSPRRNNGTK